MAKKQDQDNIVGSFGVAAEERVHEQQNIQAEAMGEEKIRKRGKGATTMTLAISAEDKALVKMYAAKQATTVSDLLHRWIQEYCIEE